MAKKKEAKAEASWADKIEQAIRKAVDSVPGLGDIPEKDYCEAVLDAIDTYKFGVDMRLGELNELDEEDD